MKKNRYGFTLVELLAVIVVLAIILAIAIPGISGVLKSSQKGAMKSDAKMLLQQVEYEKLKDSSFDISTVNVDSLFNFNLTNENYKSLLVGLVDGKPYLVIEGKNKWNGLKVCGTRINMVVVPSSDTTTCDSVETPVVDSEYNSQKGLNRPKLATGMTPIKWNGTEWVTTTTSDIEWYDYDNKEWANARTKDGSYWVWIPRYIYKISSGWHSSTTGTIEVQFSIGTDDTRDGTVALDLGTKAEASNGSWTNHPAFTFGDIELTGIWVAKFEAGGTTDSVDSKPNIPSLRNLLIGNMFKASRNIEINSKYGWDATGNDIDTHMMKNIEWGAIAYLSKSTYGKETEIWNNSNISYITGCAGSSVDAAGETICNEYHTELGQNASTTGNIYGIYDMSGGAWEYLSAYVNTGHSNIKNYGTTIVSADSKYRDEYPKGTTDTQVNNYTLTLNKKGDAMYETSSSGTGATAWYSDYSSVPRTDYPWFARGGVQNYNKDAGVFTFSCSTGNSYVQIGFRPVLLVGEGL